MTSVDSQILADICIKESILDKYQSSDPYELDLLDWYIKEIRSGTSYDELVRDVDEESRMKNLKLNDYTFVKKMKVLNWIRDNKILDLLATLPKIKKEFEPLNYSGALTSSCYVDSDDITVSSEYIDSDEFDE